MTDTHLTEPRGAVPRPVDAAAREPAGDASPLLLAIAAVALALGVLTYGHVADLREACS